MYLIPEHIALACAALILSWVSGRALGSAALKSENARLVREKRHLEGAADRNRLTSDGLREHLSESQAVSAQLERSLLELPKIAQRLAATRSLREIPISCLDLVEEIYRPSYCIFYRMSQGGLVAVATRGATPYPPGHRSGIREGVIGWAAVRQMAITAFDVARVDADEDPSIKSPDFSLCLPVVDGRRTLGVILIGPVERELPRGREVGSTIAMITAVTISHTLVLKQQEALAKTDGLTGLMNRTHLLAKLDEMIKAPRDGQPLSLFLFDVDHFKHYNDTNGHLAGDELLKQLSALLTRSVREGELVGRYGGEEFLMVLPGAVGKEALVAADRIRTLIQDFVFANQEDQPLGNVTVSGGVASWPVHGRTCAAVLQLADEALYAAKDGGRNQVRGCSAYVEPNTQLALEADCGDEFDGKRIA